MTVSDLASNVIQNGDGTTAPLTIGFLTFNGAGTININDSGVTSAPGLDITNFLTTAYSNTGGLLTIDANNALGWSPGTYDLVGFSFLLADGTAADDNIVLGTVGDLSGGQHASLGITGNDITLTVTGSPPVWTGSDGSNWLVGSTGPNHNWQSGGTAVDYANNDAVTFDDTAVTGTVNISAGNVSPYSTTFNNNAKNYTLVSGGGYGISGSGGLVKTGTGTVTIETPNTFTGSTAITSGVVNYQNGTAFGTHSPITVSTGATAQVQGGITGGTNTLAISGAGASNATGALENVSGTNSYSGPIALGGNTTISSDSGNLVLNGAIGDGGNGYELTTGGTGTITLAGSNTFTGATTINSGIVNYQNGTAFGVDSAITVVSGATAQVQGGITGGSNLLFLSGSGAANATGALENVSGNNSYPGEIELTGDTTISSDSGTLTLGGAITGAGDNLTIAGDGQVTLSAVENYSGNTIVNSGTLALTGVNTGTPANGVLNSPSIIVNNGATLSLGQNDTIGYSVGRNVVTLNDGTLYNSVAGDRDTIQNALIMNGGTLAASGTGNSGGAFSWDAPNTSGNLLDATSDASGSAAMITAPTALENSGTFFVTRGPDVTGFQPDLIIPGPIADFPTGNYSITFAGNGITALTGQSTYNAPTYIDPGATLMLGYGGTTGRLASGTDSFIVDDGTLVFDRINSGVTEGTSFPKGISGSGAVELIGSLQNVTFNSVETYTGPTTIAAGSLNVTGSLNGSSSTTVTNATLFGTGYIANPVIIGNGTDAAGTALLQPGSTTTPGTLTTGSTVSLLSDGDFVFTLNSTGGGLGASSSELIAQAVSLNSSAEFTFSDLAGTPGSLTQGDTFNVISATGGLTGAFQNLPNGAIFSSGPNSYEALYNPDGLTLEVIPEPATWGLIILGFGSLLSIQKLRKRLLGN